MFQFNTNLSLVLLVKERGAIKVRIQKADNTARCTKMFDGVQINILFLCLYNLSLSVERIYLLDVSIYWTYLSVGRIYLLNVFRKRNWTDIETGAYVTLLAGRRILLLLWKPKRWLRQLTKKFFNQIWRTSKKALPIRTLLWQQKIFPE